MKNGECRIQWRVGLWGGGTWAGGSRCTKHRLHCPLLANYSSFDWKPFEITKMAKRQRLQLPATNELCVIVTAHTALRRATSRPMEETMLLPDSRKGLPLPVRNAGESPIRNSSPRNNRRYSSSNSSGKDHSNSYVARHEQRHLAHRSDERGTSPAGRNRLRQQRSRSSAPGGARDPAVENIQHVRGKPSAFPDKIANSYGGSSSGGGRREGGLEPRGLSTTAATTLRSSGYAVDGGLAGVGASLRSSWSALPAMPNGEAVPALLSHLAGERGGALSTLVLLTY